MAERMISEGLAKPDMALEMTLRPSLFSEFTGQAKVKDRQGVSCTDLHISMRICAIDPFFDCFVSVTR